MNYIIIGIGVIIFLFIIILVYQIGKSSGTRLGQLSERKEKDETYFREILSRDKEIRDLQRKTDNLNDLNSRYLMFMFKIPTVIQHLNSTLSVQEIVESITHLITDIIPTNVVELYLYNQSHEALTRIRPGLSHNNDDDPGLNGSELIELAARDRMVKVINQIHKSKSNTNKSDQSVLDFWMAIPILFRDKLIGVIGIGKPQNIVGNETNLLKMIADIAAVALVNQTVLGEAKYQANTDPLTGISNRNYFMEMGQTFVEKAIRDSSQISIFLFDIDNFKDYNDTNGHDAGDKLLIELTALVSSITRKNAVFARYGGEEFIVMMMGITKEDALIYAERVREKIAQHPFFNRERQPLGCVSISGGLAIFPEDANTLSKTIQLADESLYHAKAEGKNRVIAHKPTYFSEHEEDIPVAPQISG